MVQPESVTQSPSQTGEVTQLLLAWSNGDQSALERLTPLVYAELHRLAHGYLRRERAGLGLQTTELIHEAWLRLAGGAVPDWRDRAHFFAVAAGAMRHVLVDLARARGYQKRGGDAQRVTLDKAVRVEDERLTEVLAVHEALDLLAVGHPRVAEVVKLKYFGGLQGNEIAEALGVSPATVTEDLKFGRAWLRRALEHIGVAKPVECARHRPPLWYALHRSNTKGIPKRRPVPRALQRRCASKGTPDEQQQRSQCPDRTALCRSQPLAAGRTRGLSGSCLCGRCRIAARGRIAAGLPSNR